MVSSPNIYLVIPSLRMGGAERCVVHLADGLARLGAAVTIISFLDCEDRFHASEKSVRRIRLEGTRTREAIPRLVRLFKADRPDVVISHLTSANVACAVACKLTGLLPRLIVVAHIAYDQALFLAHGRWLGRLALAGTKWAYGSAARVVSVSPAAAETVARTLGLAHVDVLPNPVLPPGPLPQRRTREDGPPVIVSCGRLVAHKRVDDVLRALAHVRREIPARLVVLGDGPKLAELRATADALGVAAAVEWVGFETAPLRRYADSDVLVLASEREGLPTVLIEAMAVGCPVVSTDCPTGPRELLAGGAGRLVAVGDVDGMAQAILATLRSSPDLALMARAVAPYTVDAAAKAYLALATEVISSST